jgi:hypothetical protein
MNRILLVVLIFASCVLMPSTIAAHDGDHPPDMRVWKDADGLFEIEASFVVAKDGSVQLLKHDGTLVWVPMEKLERTGSNLDTTKAGRHSQDQWPVADEIPDVFSRRSR